MMFRLEDSLSERAKEMDLQRFRRRTQAQRDRMAIWLFLLNVGGCILAAVLIALAIRIPFIVAGH